MRQSRLPPHANTDTGQSSLIPTVVQELEAEADAPEHLKMEMVETPLPGKKQKKKKNIKGAKKTTQAAQSNAVGQKSPSEHQPAASTLQTENELPPHLTSSAMPEEVATKEPMQDTVQPYPAESVEFTDELTQDAGYHSQGSSSPGPFKTDSPAEATSVDSAARPKTFLPKVTYAPEGGWLPDSSHKIRSFIQSIEHFRSSGDTQGEKEFLELQLKKYKNTPDYGRICEEATWFYLHQLEESPHLEPLYLNQDQSETHKQAPPDPLMLAEQWANKALCCYLQCRITGNISPSRLKQLITEYYDAHPEMAANPEFRKSVCSICSALGHTYSHLASARHGKAKNSLGNKARDFFSLKPLADFTNTGHAPKSIEPKLTSITREQAEQTRRS